MQYYLIPLAKLNCHLRHLPVSMSGAKHTGNKGPV